jgi:hypothetical protein
MTLVGKILVIVIMAFALFFLAVSVVVFTTEKNWKAEADKLTQEISKLKTQVQSASALVAAKTAELKTADDEREKQKKTFETKIANLEAETKTAQTEIAANNATIETSQRTSQAALEEAAAHKKETDTNRELLAQVQDQANKYALRQTELNDEIRVLKRQLDTATTNNKDLRERVAVLSGALRRAGLSDDVTQLKGVDKVPQHVEGEISRVDDRNRKVELTIGSDDGLVPGNILEVWREKPRPEYLGQIRIESVDPDQSVGVVVGKTHLGKKLQEGDLVAPTIRPRS